MCRRRSTRSPSTRDPGGGPYDRSMTAWRVGRATITPVAEVESVTSPRFLFAGLDKVGVLDLARRAPWLQGSFVDDAGYLLQRIQCLVIELDGVRVAVDTCIGNDKARANPGWNDLHLPFLADLAAAGFPPDTIDAVVCTHLHVDHVGWNTMLVDGQWMPTFPTARYLLARPGVRVLASDRVPRRRRLLRRLGRARARRGTRRPRPGRPRRRWRASDSTRRRGTRPGHVSVVVESAGQRAVITGDMIHTPVQIADVDRSSAFDFDQRRGGEDPRSASSSATPTTPS